MPNIKQQKKRVRIAAEERLENLRYASTVKTFTRRLAAAGVPPAAAAERLKRNRFYVQKLYEQAANFSPDELADAIVRLAQLDFALKGGSKLPGELEFTRALIDITRGSEAVQSASA